MNNLKQKKILIIVAAFILIAAVTGISIAFFNYTRTGSPNSFQTGRIYFSTGQSNTINLTNVFPINESDLAEDTGNHGTVTVTLTGDTEYTKGIEYLVTLDQVNNTINGKRIPIKFSVTPSNIGTSSNDYWNQRGGNTSIYKLTESGYAMEDKYVLVGFIAEGQTGINGNIQISAFIDASKILVSDTYDGSESDNMGTTNEKAAGKTVFTTTEWNNFRTTPISFKVRVEANEGIWVEKETTPASCFTTAVSAAYTRNPNMNVSTCVSKLTDFGLNSVLQSGETLEAFCSGTGTLGGRATFQYALDANWFNSSQLTELESAGIITASGYNATITDYDASCGSDVVIPSTIDGKTITAIARATEIFDGSIISYIGSFANKNLTSVELPNTINFIGDYAFYDNQLSGSIEIPDSVTGIGDYAFETFNGNSLLTQIVVPDTYFDNNSERICESGTLVQTDTSDTLNIKPSYLDKDDLRYKVVKVAGVAGNIVDRGITITNRTGNKYCSAM